MKEMMDAAETSAGLERGKVGVGGERIMLRV